MMCLGLFCVYKFLLKLFLVCIFMFVIILYLFWSGCEVYLIFFINKYEEIRGVLLIVIDCFKVIVEISKDEDNFIERIELSI